MATRIQLINKRNRLTVELKRYDDTIADIVAHGVKSFTVSTGDGQKSATNLELKELRAARASVAAELRAVKRQLKGCGPWKRIMTTRTW